MTPKKKRQRLEEVNRFIKALTREDEGQGREGGGDEPEA
jgi:hypothetical protein